MIKQIDQELSAWIVSLVGIKPSLTRPLDNDSQRGVNLYLLDLIDDTIRRSGDRPTNQPTLRYLVTTSDGKPEEAHDLLEQILFAALKSRDYEIELHPTDDQLWLTLGMFPRPYFLLRVPLPNELEPSTAPLVEGDLVVRGGAVVPFYGEIRTPGGIPLANVRIEMPNLFRSTTSDSVGKFVLSGVPAAPKEKMLLLKARKHQQTVIVEETGTEANPIQIEFNLKPETKLPV